MPEGDTVFRVARSLNEALAGTTLTRGSIRTGQFGHIDLQGELVSEVDCYGKHLLIRFPDKVLRSHLRMEGAWHIYARNARWRKPAHKARIVLANRDSVAVGFLVSDIALVPSNQEGDLIGHLGPDVLKPDWFEGGFERAKQNLERDPRPIHVALLDQRNVAGFGNEYANELCYLRGVNPWTPANEVDIPAMLKLGHRLIHANKNRVARTTTGNTRPGQRLHVYGKAGRPCPRCGTQVRFGRLGADPSSGRHVYWCPRCQGS